MYGKIGALVGAMALATPAVANGQDASPFVASDVPIAEILAEEQPTSVADATAASSDDQATLKADEQNELVSADELSELRGGETIVVGNQTLTAITAGNMFNGDYQAGAVTLSDNALSNFNGLGNFAINTGAQVSLQSGLSLVINVGK